MALYTDYKLDESYTPTKLSIRVGNTFADLREVRKLGERGGRPMGRPPSWPHPAASYPHSPPYSTHPHHTFPVLLARVVLP